MDRKTADFLAKLSDLMEEYDADLLFVKEEWWDIIEVSVLGDDGCLECVEIADTRVDSRCIRKALEGSSQATENK